MKKIKKCMKCRAGCEYSEDYKCPECGDELLVTSREPLELLCTRCRMYVELEDIGFPYLHKRENHLSGGKK
jgi:DNA-directed RNA polymerase subunit RPC12/RpoP